jgi:hypothetical protein
MTITEALKENIGNIGFAAMIDTFSLYGLYEYLETGQITGRYTFVGDQALVFMFGLSIGVIASGWYAAKGFARSLKQSSKNV